ncbi:cupredoxin domain-containing protein [Halorussus pelagicus]|uniref:cupredoxin domain-containing protein n=1 Tax=Halorussus pelagicus TaxID=2505977 RepID=UPI000FFBD217|nr:plastocyanin/azurin family copper-binding protein [Halorussus pelagicus]
MTGDSTSAERGDSGSGPKRADSADSESGTEDGLTRRTFVRVSGAAAAAGASAAFADDASAQAQTYRFGGEVAGWQGREPAAIEGEENPTIELEAGREYEFWFENLDGQPHNIVIWDGGENAIVESDIITEQGGTASVTFTATGNAAQYVCTVHPTTMIGDLNVTGETGDGGEGGLASLPTGALVLAVGLALAFLSPLLFALFLFSRGRDSGDETTTRT